MNYILFIILILSGCGGSIKDVPAPAPFVAKVTAPFITKLAVVAPNVNESTPVVFNGDLLIISTVSDHVKIYRKSDLSIVSEHVTGLYFTSALVVGNRLNIFGTSPDGKTISMLWTEDLATWAQPAVIYTAPSGVTIFNTSVAPAASGYVMAYEVCTTSIVCFNTKFLRSADLVNWMEAAGSYKDGVYTACPTIRYTDGFYYVFFLSFSPMATADHGIYFSTEVARSTDLVTWDASQITALSPLDAGDNHWNASDMDFVEYGGHIYIFYANGSQYGFTSNLGLREATFAGTTTEFLHSFF